MFFSPLSSPFLGWFEIWADFYSLYTGTFILDFFHLSSHFNPQLKMPHLKIVCPVEVNNNTGIQYELLKLVKHLKKKKKVFPLKWSRAFKMQGQCIFQKSILMKKSLTNHANYNNISFWGPFWCFVDWLIIAVLIYLFCLEIILFLLRTVILD